MAVAIRAMTPDDIPAACALFGQLAGRTMTPDEMRGRLEWVTRSPIDWLYVAEVDGTVCGIMGFRLRECLERVGHYGEVSVIVTDAGARRRGVGRALMAFAEDRAREHGCLGTWLVSGFGRKDEAHRFYEQLGYTATGYRFVKLFDGWDSD